MINRMIDSLEDYLIQKFKMDVESLHNNVEKHSIKTDEVFSEVLKREERKLDEVSVQNSSKKES